MSTILFRIQWHGYSQVLPKINLVSLAHLNVCSHYLQCIQNMVMMMMMCVCVHILQYWWSNINTLVTNTRVRLITGWQLPWHNMTLRTLGDKWEWTRDFTTNNNANMDSHECVLCDLDMSTIVWVFWCCWYIGPTYIWNMLRWLLCCNLEMIKRQTMILLKLQII